MIEIGIHRVPEVRRWTREAYHCYKRNGVCKGCINNAIMETHCNMRLTIIALVRELGVPQEDKDGNFIMEENINEDE